MIPPVDGTWIEGKAGPVLQGESRDSQVEPEPVKEIKREETGEYRVMCELRCKECNKFITKLFVVVDMLDETGKRKVVKVGFETRCPRCKEFGYHLFVV